jgi:hypothetical protein
MAKRRMTVFHTDGSKTSFSFPKQADPVSMAGEIAKALDKDKIVVEADGAMFLIPLGNVKYVQLTPAPEKLPSGVIKGASVK